MNTSPCSLGTRQALAWATVVQQHVFQPNSSIHLPTGGVSVEQERVVWGRPRAIQFRREFPFVRRIHLVGLRIARWHRSSQPPLPSSPLPWPLPMGAITTLCIVNIAAGTTGACRRLPHFAHGVRRDSTEMHCAPSACINAFAVIISPTWPAGQAHGHTVDALHHPYLS